MDATALSTATFSKCCEIVKKGMATFLEVGAALLRIRDGKLYESKYETFDDCCHKEFGMERAHAYRLMKATEAAITVSPIGDIAPENEAQVRPLTRLESPREQRAAWKEAVKTAPKDESGDPIITAKHVEEVVKERLEEKAEEPDDIEFIVATLAEPFSQATKDLNRIIREFNTMSEEKKYSRVFQAGVASRIRQAAQGLRATIVTLTPEVHEKCKGKGCERCKNSGWVNKGSNK